MHKREGGLWFAMQVQAAEGDRVEVQVGGSFLLTSQDMQRPLLFVAGGIGITPLAAMLAHLAEQGLPDRAEARQAPAALLLYSAGTVDELVFRRELLSLAQQCEGEPGLPVLDTGSQGPGRIWWRACAFHVQLTLRVATK